MLLLLVIIPALDSSRTTWSAMELAKEMGKEGDEKKSTGICCLSDRDG